VSQGARGIRALPGVDEEIEKLKQWLAQYSAKLPVKTLCNAEANKQAVVEQLPQAQLLHVSCHGIFEPNRPDASGLVLIPHPSRVEILSLRDLLSLDLSQVHHATLSSCWAADHFVLPGRWVISLPETLWRGGVHSILGNLWEVDDSISIAFMARFYQNLETMSRAEALRQAQLDCLNNRLSGCSTLDTSNPFYWAGHTLYGDEGRLEGIF
jgi:CHAT domain-containing protein